jgi:hypothetical protein
LVVVDAVEEDENTSGASTKNRSANRSKKLLEKLLLIDRLQFLCWHYSSSHLGSEKFMKMIDDV